MSIKVLLADDNESFRNGIRAVLEKEKDILIIGEANDGHESFKMTKKLLPDIIIMDIKMPKLNGIDATQQIVKKMPLTSVLVVSAEKDQHLAGKILKTGAKGYVPKSSVFNELINAIRTIQKGNIYLSPSIIGEIYISSVLYRG